MNHFVYVIGPAEPPIKIGISKNCEKRVKSLQTGHSQKLLLHYAEPVSPELARVFEQIIHNNLRLQKTQGEWFNISVEDAINEIKWAIIRYSEEPNLKQQFKNRTLLI